MTRALQADHMFQGSSRPNSHTPTSRPISIHLHLLDFQSFSPPLPGLPAQLLLTYFLDRRVGIPMRWAAFKTISPDLVNLTLPQIFQPKPSLCGALIHPKSTRRPDRPEFEWPEILGAIARRARPTASLLCFACLPQPTLLCAAAGSGSLEIGPRTTACLPVAFLRCCIN